MKRLPLALILASIGVTAASSVFAVESQIDFNPANNLTLIAQADQIAANQFVDVEHPTQGQVKIVEAEGKRYLELSEDFQSDRGPALEVILHRANEVGLQVQEGEYVSLGELQAFSGSQRYLIPDNVDLSQYQSVAIWCEEFNATFGYAPLAQ